MNRLAIQMTRFQVEALKCIGEDGGATPHHLTTYTGPELGSIGSVMKPMGQTAVVSNQRRQRKPRRLAQVRELFPNR
jgi:hypothetical protein